VTPKRARGISDQPYIPDKRLIQGYALRYSWEPAKLTAVLSQFGRLPEAGQEQLIRCLVLAFGRYQMLAKTVRHVTPSEQRNQLTAVEKTARKLLLQLGVNPKDVASHPFWDKLSDHRSSERLQFLGKQSLDGLGVTSRLASAGINIADRDEAEVNAELSAAYDRVADAVIGLLDLHERAKTAAQAATKRMTAGRGGSRHRPTAKGQLIRYALVIYAHMRGQHLNSGNKPGFGRPMLEFIQAVATLYGARVCDADIREVWRRWKSNQK